MYSARKELLILQGFPGCPVSQKKSFEKVNNLKTRGCCQAEKYASLTMLVNEAYVSKPDSEATVFCPV
jgi:hypothetical protein